MKSIPTRPKMSEEEMAQLQEQFMRGNKLPEIKQGQGKFEKGKKASGKGGVKMYNLPLPVDVHTKAKIIALMEGKSLAAYIISAIEKANNEATLKS